MADALKPSVMQKYAATMHRPLPATASVGLMFHGILAKLQNAIRIEIPIGYQDETGFHRGVKPAERGAKWPSVW
jgi:hypothetical protein